MSNTSVNTEQKEFFEYFEKLSGCSPDSMELVSFGGTPAAMKRLGLELPVFQRELWGLLVFCGEKLFFYIHPAEYSYMGLVRKDEKNLSTKEQCICFNDFYGFSVSAIKRPKLLKFLFSSHVIKAYVTETDGQEADSVEFTMQSMAKADVLLEKLKPYLH